MFFAYSTAPRRKPLRGPAQGHGLAAEEQRPSGEGMACGQRQRPAAGRPGGREQRPAGESCTAIKITEGRLAG